MEWRRTDSLSSGIHTEASFSFLEDHLDKDLKDWMNLTPEEKRFTCRVVVFLAAYCDDAAWEYLIQRFPEDEANLFSGSDMNTTGLLRTKLYGFFIETYIKHPDERTFLFETMPFVQKKLNWISKYMTNIAEASVAFAVQKEVFFAGSFAFLFWLEKRGLMQSLTSINESMSQVQGSNTYVACMMYRCGKPAKKLKTHEIITMVKEAVIIEQEFLSNILSETIVDMSTESLKTYVEFAADRLLVQLNCPNVYNVENPFNFIRHCPSSLCSRTSFFIKRVTEYEKIKSRWVPTFSLDTSF